MDLIFIHIGDLTPSYFEHTIRHTRSFCSCRIFLICPVNNNTRRIAKKYNCELIPHSSFETEPEIKILNKSNLFEFKGQKLFWLSCLKRLFYLSIFVRENEIYDSIHIENDVLLFCNVENLLPIFKRHYANSVAATPISPIDGVTAAILYLPNPSVAQLLIDDLCNLILTPKSTLKKILDFDMLNEMAMLGCLFNMLPDRYIPLPTLPNNPKHYPQMKRWNKSRKIFDYLNFLFPIRLKTLPEYGLSHNINNFNSIFDGASWGQFVDGTPNGHKPGICFPHHWVGAELAHKRYSIFWKTDDFGRICPFIKSNFDDKVYKINNLHIHSKRIENFVDIR